MASADNSHSIMNNKESWYALEIGITSDAYEAIEFGLNELDSIGTEISTLGTLQKQVSCVIGYFNEKPSDEEVKNELSQALRIYGFSGDEIVKTEWKEIENQDWLAEWKKHWKPTETDKFIIAPSWENVKSEDKFVIEIEPGMAFGTGTHETTKLCLRAIENNYKEGMSFFDVGTGTGILSIAAQKLSGVEKVRILACDVDSEAVKIATENARLNGAENIEFYVGSINKESRLFDFVCANVTVDIIIPLLPLLVEKTKQILVLSGILIEQENSVLEELKKLGTMNYKTKADGEWVSILVEK